MSTLYLISIQRDIVAEGDEMPSTLNNLERKIKMGR